MPKKCLVKDCKQADVSDGFCEEHNDPCEFVCWAFTNREHGEVVSHRCGNCMEAKTLGDWIAKHFERMGDDEDGLHGFLRLVYYAVNEYYHDSQQTTDD